MIVLTRNPAQFTLRQTLDPTQRSLLLAIRFPIPEQGHKATLLGDDKHLVKQTQLEIEDKPTKKMKSEENQK